MVLFAWKIKISYLCMNKIHLRMVHVYTQYWRGFQKVVISFFALMLVWACGAKEEIDTRTVEEKEKEIVEKEIVAKKEVVRLREYTQTDSVKGNGHKYVYTIRRQVDRSLGLVTDDEGYRTADNAITLTMKCDGVQVLSRRYTKGNFKMGVEDGDYEQFVLMNMAYDKMTVNGPRFIVCVGVGSSDDMFVQYTLTVDGNGGTKIEPHEFYEDNEINRIKDGMKS